MTLKTYNDHFKLIRRNPVNILSIPFAERSEALIREAIKRDENMVYRFEPDEMDERYARAVAKVQPRRLDYLPKHLRTTEVLRLAVNYKEMLRYAPPESLTVDLVDEALAEAPLAVKYVPEQWITSELAQTVVQADAFAYVDLPKAFQTRSLAGVAVKIHGAMLHKIDPTLWDDDLVDTALSESPFMIHKISAPWLTAQRVIDALERIGGSKLALYRHIPEALKTNQMKWRFLQRGIEVIGDITLDEFKVLLEECHPTEPLMVLASGLTGALKQLNKPHEGSHCDLAAKYIAATCSLDDLVGKRLNAQQVQMLAPYFGTGPLLTVTKVKPEDKRSLLSSNLEL